jgi:hypothetical protein
VRYRLERDKSTDDDPLQCWWITERGSIEPLAAIRNPVIGERIVNLLNADEETINGR